MTDENLTIDENIELQKAKTLNDQVNIVLAANSFLFMPFVTLIVGAKDLVGLFVFAPIIICAIGILLDIGLVYYIFFAKDLKSLRDFDKKLKESKKISIPILIDSFKKYASLLLLFAWMASLILVCVQILPGMIN